MSAKREDVPMTTRRAVPGKPFTPPRALHLLLVLVVVAPIAERLHWGALAVFLCSALAIVPLAGLMGEATEQLASRLGSGIGGLLNATFGNAAELIIALAALRAGLYDVVKASIAGSILGNTLCVLGTAMLAGGLRHAEQHFNATGARARATTLTLSPIALLLPPAAHSIADTTDYALVELSIGFSVVLLLMYLLLLAFVLITHPQLFAGLGPKQTSVARSSAARSIAILAAATA